MLQIVKKAIREYDLSVTLTAKLCRVKRGLLSNWLRGNSSPSFDNYRRLNNNFLKNLQKYIDKRAKLSIIKNRKGVKRIKWQTIKQYKKK